MGKADVMKMYFSARNWSLFLVMPLAGLGVVILLHPIKLGLLNAPSGTAFTELWATSISQLISPDPATLVPIALLILPVGLLVQGISVLRRHWSSCSVTGFIFDCLVRGKCAVSEKEKATRKSSSVVGNCERYRYSHQDASVATILLRHLSTRVNMACSKEISIKYYRQEHVKQTRVPIPGTSAYADFQIYLERNKHVSSYVEWEKFLKLLYEYSTISMQIAFGGYVLFGLWVLVAYGVSELFDLSYLITLSMTASSSWVFYNATIVHSAAFNQAQQSAYNEYLSKSRNLYLP